MNENIVAQINSAAKPTATVGLWSWLAELLNLFCDNPLDFFSELWHFAWVRVGEWWALRNASPECRARLAAKYFWLEDSDEYVRFTLWASRRQRQIAFEGAVSEHYLGRCNQRQVLALVPVRD